MCLDSSSDVVSGRSLPSVILSQKFFYLRPRYEGPMFRGEIMEDRQTDTYKVGYRVMEFT